MKRWLSITLLLLLTLCFSLGAAGETVNISRELAPGVTVEASITLPEKDTYSTYKVAYADLTQDPTRSAQALADALFSDPASPRTTQQQLDEYREGGVVVSSQAGESVYSGQDGRLRYQKDFLIQRYGNSAVEAMLWEKGASDGNIEDFFAQSALDAALSALNPYRGDFDISLYRAYGITGDMLRAGYDAAQTPQPDPPFGPADDQYVFQFVYVLDGLPVFSESKEEDNVIWRNTLANPVMSAYKGQVYVNREGVYALYVDHPELGQAGEPRTILTADQALDALGAFLGNQILQFPIQITGGWVEYLPVPNQGSFYEGELRPFWCFSTSVYLDDGTGQGDWFSDRTYLVNAFTGKVRT